MPFSQYVDIKTEHLDISNIRLLGLTQFPEIVEGLLTPSGKIAQVTIFPLQYLTLIQFNIYGRSSLLYLNCLILLFELPFDPSSGALGRVNFEG